jgi:hypothetical protein
LQYITAALFSFFCSNNHRHRFSIESSTTAQS